MFDAANYASFGVQVNVNKSIEIPGLELFFIFLELWRKYSSAVFRGEIY